MKRTLVSFAAMALLLAACGGGGSTSPVAPGSSTAAQTLQQVSGTITIGTAGGVSASSSTRRPAYVSTGTTRAWVFINGAAATANGTAATCPGKPTGGTGTACTIPWSTALPVPAAYTFAVETDDGTNVLAVGSGSYVITAGVNTLTPALTLNGVVAKASFATTSCVAGTAGVTAGTCNGTVTLDDFSSNAIVYGGALTVPTPGTAPTNGTVYDNGSPTFTSSNATAGVVTGIAQSSGGSTFSTFAAATHVLTVGGVNTTGVYTYSVACATNVANGTFTINVGGTTATGSGIISSAQLSTIGAVYPSSVTTIATAPSYTCANGVMSSATGTLPVN
jgi:hypothetical protein